MIALALFALLSLAAGAAVVGMVGVELRAEVRVPMAIVAGTVFPAMASFLVASAIGLTPLAVLLGPVAVIVAVAVAVVLGAPSPADTWRASWNDAAVRWRLRPRYGLVAFAAVTTVFFWWIFGRALTVDSTGTLYAGYQTVWADWSQHLTTASSFAVSHNLPPQNPLFSGTPLFYPFMPDFHSAELMVLGMSPQTALAFPGALLAICVALLLVGFAERLGARPATGAIAAAMAVLGGGLGFARVVGDACIRAQGGAVTSGSSAFDISNAARNGCDIRHVVTSPGSWPGIVGNLTAVIQNQPRAYDGLLTDYTQLPVHNLQWPTPLMGWWLPQRSFVYGCAMVMAIVVIVAGALRDERRHRAAWLVAGVMAGLLPLFHVHSLIALGLITGVVALMRWRREWLIFGVATLVVAAPRLWQLAGSPHGSAQTGNQYPSLVVGWRYLFDPSLPNSGLDQSLRISLSDVLTRLAHAVVLPLQADWWSFWILNLGIAVPLCALVLAAVGIRRFAGGRARRYAERVLAPFPSELLPWALGCMLVFAAANVVVFQTWDWDNTKLFAYWYLGVGLLTGCLVMHLTRRWWGRIMAASVLVITLASGVLVVVRVLPLEATASRQEVAGPFPLVTSADVAFAQQIAADTAADAVFVTTESPQDPVSTIAGRTTVLGYFGWLWSYGTVFGSRVDDVKTIVGGCAPTALDDPACPIRSLLDTYHVSYVEIDPRGSNSGLGSQDIDAMWWATQGLPVVARSTTGDRVLYDVRRHSP